MIFNSLVFAVFLIGVLGAHLLWPRSLWRAEKWFLLAASYVFYGWWDVRFLSLLAISTVIDWSAVAGIHRNPALRNRWLGISLVSNLGLLGFFKYWNFFIDSASVALVGLGLDPARYHLDIVLPVGISFYTFQTMSLTIDAWRGQIKETPSFLDTALYVSFFPQLVAGPIVRASSFLPQIRHKPRFRAPLFMWGWWLAWLGLFKKVVLADNLAPLVDAHYASADLANLSAVLSWKAAVAFSLQIYGDFSGYSDVAIGVAMLLGIRFPVNFRAPYVATSFSDFWRRWHISLSTWLRDYLYIPLGGNRRGPLRTRINLAITMLLGGLWHGASWNFVLWGGAHGAALGGEQAIFGRDLHHRPRSWWTDGARTLLVFLLITLLWVPFRAADFATTAAMLQSMLLSWAWPGVGSLLGQLPIFAICFAMIATAFLRERGVFPRRGSGWLRVVAACLMVHAISTIAGGSRAFIYFQF